MVLLNENGRLFMGASKHSYINLLDFNFQVIFMHRKAEQKVKGPAYPHHYSLPFYQHPTKQCSTCYNGWT